MLPPMPGSIPMLDLGDARAAAARVGVPVAIANWSMFAQRLRSLEVPLEDGVEPWPPDGAVPDAARTDVASELI
jgi:hypothetical protein